MNKMKTFICLATLMVCAYAQFSMKPRERSWPSLRPPRLVRYTRDLTWDKQVGANGKIFGTLGQDDNGAFGKAGYNHQIFNDDRGKLNAEAYGSRVLGPYGDSTNFGGKLNWADQNAKASVDVSRPIGGYTGLRATGEGKWDLGKNTHLSAGGFYEQQHLGHGRPDYGFLGQIRHDF